MTKQTAGNDSVIVSAGGSVTVVSGLTMSETKDLFHLMLRESLAGIQAEAMKVAEVRNEKLIDDLLSTAQERFGDKLEEKLAEFRDPGAQYAFRSAQTEYCKYGNDSAELDAVELLMARIGEARDTSEKVIYDEAIRICGRLSDKQIDLACVFLILHVVRFGGVTNVQRLDEIITQAGKHLGGLSCGRSELSLMSLSGIIQLHPGGGHWNPISGILRGKYEGLMTHGMKLDELGLPGCLENGSVIRYLRNASLYQFNGLRLADWAVALRERGYSPEQVEAAVEVAKQKLWSDDEVYDYLVKIAPEFAQHRDALQTATDGVLSYNLTPIGIAIAVARTRRDGWRTDLQLSQLI